MSFRGEMLCAECGGACPYYINGIGCDRFRGYEEGFPKKIEGMNMRYTFEQSMIDDAPALDKDAFETALDAATEAHRAGEEEQGQCEAAIKAYLSVVRMKERERVYRDESRS